MANFTQRLSLRFKLVSFVALSIFLLVMVLGGALSWNYFNDEKKKLAETLTQELSIVSYTMSAGLEFNDTKAVDTDIDLLKNVKEFVSVKVSDLNGRVFSTKSFQRSSAGSNLFTVQVPIYNETNIQIGIVEASATTTYFMKNILTVVSVVFLVTLLVTIFVIFVAAFIIEHVIHRPLTSMIGRLKDGSEQTLSAAQQVESSSLNLSKGATEQASSLEQTSSALDQMASMTRQNADNASKASQMAIETKFHAEKGDISMKEMQSSMVSIGESANKVGKIIKTIEEIAFQTNLLALNAAVEAARAGEHGKGFAVVANEVRNLAQRASVAAKDTQQLIEDSQTRTREGSEISRKTGEALGQIMDAAKKVADVVNEIARASKEQAEGINQVTQAVSRMDSVTQQNAASAEESAAASKELSTQSESLKEIAMGLQQIVSGQNRATGLMEKNVALEKINRPYQNIRRPVVKQASKENKGPKLLKPEDVIPFDDKEGFKDF